MKKIALLALFATSLFACTNKTEIQIKGKTENIKPKSKIYLTKINDITDIQVIDSTVLNDNGEFVFNQKSKGQSLYNIQVNGLYYPIVADDGDVLTLNIDGKFEAPSYTISGNKASESLSDYSKLNIVNLEKRKAIEKEFETEVKKNPNDKAKIIQKLQPKFMDAVRESEKQLIDLATKNTDNLIGIYAILNLDANNNSEAILAFSKKVGPSIKDLPIVQSFLKKANAITQTAIGSVAPEFSGKTPDGKTLKLSDYKGKYVLVDFWASWCGPCRQENPNVVKAFEHYKNKNFTILGVSLDQNSDDWQKAIKNDHLTWSHVSDLKGFKSDIALLYNIQAIPTNFLIGPDGKIVAKNLRAENLEITLAKHL